MLTHFSCNDCDELSDSLPDTQQDCRQTVPGSFLGQWWQLELPGLSIVKHETNYGLHNSAVISDSSLLAYLPIKQGGTLVLEGHSWDGPALFFAQPKTCPVVSVPSDFACYTIEFDLTELSRTANAPGRLITTEQRRFVLPFRSVVVFGRGATHQASIHDWP